MDPLPADGVQDERRQECRPGRQDRPAQGLVHSLVDHRGRHVSSLASQFAKPVEDHDRIVDRKADDREQRRHHVEADLEVVHEGPAQVRGDIGAQGQAGDGHEHVVRQRNHGRQAEGDVLEADPDIQHDHQQAGEQGIDGGDLGIPSHLAADRVGGEIDRGLGERRLHSLENAARRGRVECGRQRPVAAGPARGRCGLGGCDVEIRITDLLGLERCLDRRPERRPADLLGKAEFRDRGRHRLGRRITPLAIPLLSGGSGLRRHVDDVHAVRREPTGKQVADRRLHVPRLIAPQRRVDLVPQIRGAPGRRYRTHRGVWE